MGERLLCKQEVVGSIPITSTTERAKLVSSAAAVAQQPREHPRGRRRTLIDREKQFAQGCELVGV